LKLEEWKNYGMRLGRYKKAQTISSGFKYYRIYGLLKIINLQKTPS
jgi:hypothetical protein